jgi:hypothetical protein
MNTEQNREFVKSQRDRVKESLRVCPDASCKRKGHDTRQDKYGAVDKRNS